MYAFDLDPGFQLCDVRWSGMFCARGVAEYADALRRAFITSGFAPGYLLRIDMRDSAFQSQDGLAAFRREFAGFPAASRIAIVTRSAIGRLQVEREMRQPYLRIAGNPDSALDWLIGGRDQADLSSLPRFST